MEFLAEVAAWFADPLHWQGRDGVPNRLAEHLVISGVSLVLALAVALPLGLYIGHTNRFATVAVNLSNVGRAVPSLGWLGIAFPITLSLGLGLGFWPTVIALVALAVPPIVTNSYVGLRDVDDDLREAAAGMGMSGLQLLRRVELPLALPVILAGVRTSAVQVVATATLGAILSAGTLGYLIIEGIATRDLPQVFAGAVLVGVLAIATELTFAWLQRRAVSAGLRAPDRMPAPAAQAGQPGAV